jgi:hypothetical protein
MGSVALCHRFKCELVHTWLKKARGTELFEAIFIWGGAATAAYGVYLWGPTGMAFLPTIPVPQAAKYFVFVTGSGIIGKIVVSFVPPIATAASYHGFTVAGVPVMVLLLSASTFCIDGSFSNASCTVESYGVRPGARSSGVRQTANGVGKILGPLAIAVIAGTSNIVSRRGRARRPGVSCSWSGCPCCSSGSERTVAMTVEAKPGRSARHLTNRANSTV